MQTVTLEEAKERLLALVTTESRDEGILITLDNRPIAKLTPLPASVPPEPPGVVPGPDRGYGVWRGQVVLHPGWDDPLEEFDDYR